ncbi:hypothetical protein JCM11957_17710 [Caminibacter profundus]
MKKIIILIPFLLFATNLKIQVNKTKIMKNEELIITIIAKGKNIVFPNPTKIAGYNVVGTSINNNIMIINGEVKESISKTFIIVPDKNITIPSFNVKIDGKIYKTKPIKITVITPKQTKGDFELDLNISKKRLYLGESAILSITFKQTKDIGSLKIIEPKIDGFLIKPLSKETKNNIKYKFLIIPQKAGNYKIGPVSAQIGKIVKEKLFGDPFFTITNMKYKTIYSNSLEIEVMPIPKGSIFGDFNITLNTKNVVLSNKPNIANLKITGCGDFIDMPNFSLNIQNATVYNSKPSLKVNIINNKFCGIYEQNFTIISDTNYTIPSFTLKKFNGTTKTISTKPVKVYVIGTVKKSKTKEKDIQKNDVIVTKKENYNILFFIIGIVIGSIGTYLLLNLKKKEKDIYSKIKSANQKELFNLLIPYSNDEYIKETLKKLEENIYKNYNHKIDKKLIIKRLKAILN